MQYQEEILKPFLKISRKQIPSDLKEFIIVCMLNLVQGMPDLLKIGWNYLLIAVNNCCLTNESNIFSFSQHIINYFMDKHTEYLIFINQNLKNFLSLLIHFILKADKELSNNCLTH
jgi:hypothetical protein